MKIVSAEITEDCLCALLLNGVTAFIIKGLPSDACLVAVDNLGFDGIALKYETNDLSAHGKVIPSLLRVSKIMGYCPIEA